MLGQEGAVDAMPGTPGLDGCTVESAEGGGPNGLGPASHGVYLGEEEMTSLSLFVRWGVEALDIAVLSPSASALDLTEMVEAYTGVIGCFEKDRNHLRDVLASCVGRSCPSRLIDEREDDLPPSSPLKWSPHHR